MDSLWGSAGLYTTLQTESQQEDATIGGAFRGKKLSAGLPHPCATERGTGCDQSAGSDSAATL